MRKVVIARLKVTVFCTGVVNVFLGFLALLLVAGFSRAGGMRSRRDEGLSPRITRTFWGTARQCARFSVSDGVNWFDDMSSAAAAPTRLLVEGLLFMYVLFVCVC